MVSGHHRYKWSEQWPDHFTFVACSLTFLPLIYLYQGNHKHLMCCTPVAAHLMIILFGQVTGEAEDDGTTSAPTTVEADGSVPTALRRQRGHTVRNRATRGGTVNPSLHSSLFSPLFVWGRPRGEGGGQDSLVLLTKFARHLYLIRVCPCLLYLIVLLEDPPSNGPSAPEESRRGEGVGEGSAILLKGQDSYPR